MRRFRWLILLVAAPAALYFYPDPILRPLGEYLVEAEEPVPSDCLFVLGGGFDGTRILRAAELYRKGMAPKVIISGPRGLYDSSEDEMAIEYAKKHGAGDIPFIGLPHSGRSTAAEAIEVLPALREQGCRTVLVVTHDFHTRRAGRTLRRLWPDLQVRMVAAPTDDYDATNWWKDRNRQKTFFFEWSKTFADWIGL